MSNYNEWHILGMAAIVAGLCLLPWTWKLIITHVITLAHEYGHAFIGLVTEGRIRKIKIHVDSSGSTETVRELKFIPLGATITTLAGYPAPILLGAFLLMSVDKDFRWISTIAFLVFGLFCLLFIRNFFGLIMALFWIGFFALLAVLQPDFAPELTLWAGLVLFIGGIKDLLNLTVMWYKKESEGSDLSILKEQMRFPQIFSLILMFLISGGVSFLLFTF